MTPPRPVHPPLVCAGKWLPPLGIALVVLALRTLLIGQPPFTDEGVYASMAYLVWHHPFEVLPSLCPISSINLYPWLLAWLAAFPTHGLLGFRMADAVLAAGCSMTLYAVVCLLTRNRMTAFGLTLVWALAVNHPVLINAGFKNAYAPGFLCIVGACWLVLRHPDHPPVIRMGLLIGLVFLLREPLAIFALPLAVYLALRHSWTQAAAFSGVAILATLAGLAGLGFVRGGDIASNLQNIAQSWQDISSMHATILATDRIDLAAHRSAQFQTFFNPLAWAIGGYVVAILSGLWIMPRTRSNLALVALAGLTALAPLPEFWLKLGFPYHLGASLLGLVLLAALCLKFVRKAGTRTHRLLTGTALLCCGLIPTLDGQNSFARWTRGMQDAARSSHESLSVMAGHQPVTPESPSFYLKAAAAIRRHTTPGESVLVSGFYGGLYLLSDRRPPSLVVTDLSTYALSRYFRLTPRERAELNSNLPAVFVETNRFPAFDLKSLIDDFPDRYVLVDSIPTGSAHYGGFACRIYRRTPP